MDEKRKESPVIITLSKEDLQELLEKAAAVGAKTGIDRYEEELKKAQGKRVDRRFHNTKLLLRNYRMLQVNAENSVFGRTQMKESAADILESMMNIYSDQVIVESIKNSATRTAIIVSHVKTMIDMYQISCERSNSEIDKRRFDIIHGLYISSYNTTRKELAKKWSVSVDTTYSDEKITIERLSALIFGVDGLC